MTEGKFFETLEQLHVVKELILSDSPANSQMALIKLDAIADAIIFSRLQEIYTASEHPLWSHKMPSFSKRERQRARNRFNRRVEITREITTIGWWTDDREFVTEDDATVLKVAHNYSNDAYHKGTQASFRN